MARAREPLPLAFLRALLLLFALVFVWVIIGLLGLLIFESSAEVPPPPKPPPAIVTDLGGAPR